MVRAVEWRAPTPSPRAANSLASQGLDSWRAGSFGTMRRSAPRPGRGVADASNGAGEGAPLGNPIAPQHSFSFGGWVGNWEKGGQSCGFQPSAPPQPGAPFRPALRVALFLGFTFWRYRAHDSAPGRGEGEGETRPRGFKLPRVGGRRSRRRRRERAVIQEKSQPRPLCCSRLRSAGSCFFLFGLPTSSSHSAKLTAIFWHFIISTRADLRPLWHSV